MTNRIAFVGGGHMATSLIGGLIARGTPADAITVADPESSQRERLQRDFGVHVVEHGVAAVDGADVVVLAVKPQQMAEVCRAIAPALVARRPLVISIAAGIRLQDLARWLGPEVPLVRTMPNRPALIGAGITALLRGPRGRRRGAGCSRPDHGRLWPDGLGDRRIADGRRHRGVRQRAGLFLPADRSDRASGHRPRARPRHGAQARRRDRAWRGPHGRRTA